MPAALGLATGIFAPRPEPVRASIKPRPAYLDLVEVLIPAAPDLVVARAGDPVRGEVSVNWAYAGVPDHFEIRVGDSIAYASGSQRQISLADMVGGSQHPVTVVAVTADRASIAGETTVVIAPAAQPPNREATGTDEPSA